MNNTIKVAMLNADLLSEERVCNNLTGSNALKPGLRDISPRATRRTTFRTSGACGGTAQRLAEESQVDRLVILTACYFHDIVSLPKNHPERSRSFGDGGRKNAGYSPVVIPDFPCDRYPAVYHAIEAHSFSAGISPQSAEAKIVQDADRLEALGAIGLARVFAVSGALNNILFDADDPFADRRKLDDKKYALDHFQCKLLRLPETMQTDKGKEMALHNAPLPRANLWPSLALSFAATRSRSMRRF
ncbi:putative hydrolase [Raoultella planticola]|uniref:Putative hydrolase n=1 Tax=Raoultella planticola TaxID=575 RepID=A0A485ACQ1_RAOPL|nr:putative hydrolase [Raoultella planticola]